MFRSNSKGFTLLELLVVLVIIGLLAGYIAPKYFSQIGKSEVKTAKAQINSLEQALDHFRLDVGKYPSTDQGLASLVTNPGIDKWDGPYLAKGLPKDPWGKDYQYASPGTHHNDYDLYSYGKDEAEGGEGENQDIVNW